MVFDILFRHALFRLHHDEQVKNALYRCHKQSGASGVPAKNKLVPGFTQRYNITRLAYFERYDQINDAIAREKQIKGFLRSKKIALIESVNPSWTDLSG